MKRLVYLLLVLLLIPGAAVFAEIAEDQPSAVNTAAPGDQPAPWTYVHDPRDNPKAMRDIVVNPAAVYGFSPSPAEDSTLKQYVDSIDWSDPAQVAEARAQRLAYHESLDDLYEIIIDMIEQDLDVETIARAVSTRRNELRLEAYRDDPEGLATVKARNLEIYGDEFGPTPDSLYEKYESWDMVLYKALGTNAGMDACVGLYDDYWFLYDLENVPDPDTDSDTDSETDPEADTTADPETVPTTVPAEDPA